MSNPKNKEKYLLFFLFLLTINLSLINSQNLCPYKDLQDLLIYYTKGINPIKDKWEYIHCVNNYNNSGYLIRNNKDPYFNENAGIFIGSSINIGKLDKELISTFSIYNIDKANLIKLVGKFDTEAESLYKNITFHFTSAQINNMNEQVYKNYSEKMKNFFDLKVDYGYSFNLTLLTFFVKYYGMNKYLEEAKTYLQKIDNNNLFLLSHYFLNLKSDNYPQKKLWSMITLSSDKNYFINNISHIGIYYDTKLKQENKKEFREFIKNLTKEFNFENYTYSLGNFSGIIKSFLKRQNFIDFIKEFNFTSDYSGEEDINQGINNFIEIFDKDLTEYYSYYQKHLIIFVNDINNIKKPINKTYFIKKGIQVILFAKINKKSDENELIKKFGDEFNIISFINYSELILNNNYLMLLRNIINYNIQNYFFDNTNKIINISNIKTFGKNNMHNFKITFNQTQINSKNKNNEQNYFHISLIYNNAEEIQSDYKKNANLTFFLSEKNPFSDIINNDIINFCLNDTVYSDPNKSPFINYIITNKSKNYFYISIANANNINYTLTITLEKTYETNINKSNGIFKSSNSLDHNSKEFVATFSNNCIQKNCEVDYFSLLKYFSSGVHFTKSQDEFNKIINKHLIICLYRNVFCPFFDIENEQQTVIKYEKGYLIGYGFNLSNVTSNQLFNKSIPLYIINKLNPFLSENLNMSIIKKALNDSNLYLTSEEVDTLNMNYLSNIYNNILKEHKKFSNFNSNLKLALFLRVLEESPSFEKIEYYLNQLEFKKFEKYIRDIKEKKLNRLTTKESTDFQMMLIQTGNIIKPKKCLVSLVLGKSLLWSDEFFDFINKLNEYRISITYFDSATNKVILLEDFNEDIDEIKNKVIDFKNKNEFERTEMVDIDLVLQQQKNLFKYYDEGIKKCIVVISTRDNEAFYRYDFTKPNKDLLQELYDSGIIIFDYSDHINFVLNEVYENDLDFFNSNKTDFIQYVPFLNYSDMNNNTVTLSNMINRYPIPIIKIDDIYLDLEREEVITYEFNLINEIKKLKEKNYFDQYNQLKLSFSVSSLNIYLSRRYIYPNNFSHEVKFEVNEDNNEIIYDLKELFDKKFFMSIQTANRVDNSIIKIDLCDTENNCLKEIYYIRFYIGFGVAGALILVYALYIIFCDNTFKKEGNIFEKK